MKKTMRLLTLVLAVVLCTGLITSCSEQISPVEEIEIREVPSTENGKDKPAYDPFNDPKTNG